MNFFVIFIDCEDIKYGETKEFECEKGKVLKNSLGTKSSDKYTCNIGGIRDPEDDYKCYSKLFYRQMQTFTDL